MSQPQVTHNPPLLVTHEELAQLDTMLDECNHGFAKKMIQWVNWVRRNREQEVLQHKQQQKELQESKELKEKESNLRSIPAESNGTAKEVTSEAVSENQES